MKNTSRLQLQLHQTYGAYVDKLGPEAVNDMAFPSYLFGNKLSRYVFWKKLDFVLDAASLKPDLRVFDFGCGSGILLASLCRDNRKVYATDLRLGPAQHLAKELTLENIVFYESDQWNEEIANQSLDVIIAANVLEHVNERNGVLRQFASKLVPGGRLVISGPTENKLYRLGRRIVGFTGDYHVATVHDVFADALSVDFKKVFHRHWPLPNGFCLYQIAAFTPVQK